MKGGEGGEGGARGSVLGQSSYGLRWSGPGASPGPSPVYFPLPIRGGTHVGAAGGGTQAAGGGTQEGVVRIQSSASSSFVRVYTTSRLLKVCSQAKSVHRYAQYAQCAQGN